MIVQNTIIRTTLFQIDSFDSRTCPLGGAEKKNLLNLASENSAGKFRVILQIGFDIIITIIVQNTIFTFELTVLIAGCVSLERQK